MMHTCERRTLIAALSLADRDAATSAREASGRAERCADRAAAGVHEPATGVPDDDPSAADRDRRRLELLRRAERATRRRRHEDAADDGVGALDRGERDVAARVGDGVQVGVQDAPDGERDGRVEALGTWPRRRTKPSIAPPS
jgi:hypothetical protein